MDRLRVVAPQGATIRGPAIIALSLDQHRRRAHVLLATRKKGVFEVPEGAAITLKHGETFGMDVDGRLNKGLFEDLDAAAKAEKAKAEDAEDTASDGEAEGEA